MKKTKKFPFAPENKKFNPDDFSDYMKTIKPDTYTQTKNVICDWSDRKNYLILFRMVTFYVTHGMQLVEIHTVTPLKQSKLLEKYKSFNTQKRNKAKHDFEKDF